MCSWTSHVRIDTLSVLSCKLLCFFSVGTIIDMLHSLQPILITHSHSNVFCLSIEILKLIRCSDKHIHIRKNSFTVSMIVWNSSGSNNKALLKTIPVALNNWNEFIYSNAFFFHMFYRVHKLVHQKRRSVYQTMHICTCMSACGECKVAKPP